MSTLRLEGGSRCSGQHGCYSSVWPREGRGNHDLDWDLCRGWALPGLLFWATSGLSWLCVFFGHRLLGHINSVSSVPDLGRMHIFQESDALAQWQLCLLFHMEDSRFSTNIHWLCPIEIKALVPKDLCFRIFIMTSFVEAKKMKT